MFILIQRILILKQKIYSKRKTITDNYINIITSNYKIIMNCNLLILIYYNYNKHYNLIFLLIKRIIILKLKIYSKRKPVKDNNINYISIIIFSY